jgi:hypothetical protein
VHRLGVGDPQWWTVRPGGSLKPATYRCPFCERLLHATSEHLLISPEGDSSRRRHAHTECVAEARRAGRFRTRDEWRALLPRPPGVLARIFRRG